jgi:hypothetical protein
MEPLPLNKVDPVTVNDAKWVEFATGLVAVVGIVTAPLPVSSIARLADALLTIWAL